MDTHLLKTPQAQNYEAAAAQASATNLCGNFESQAV